MEGLKIITDCCFSDPVIENSNTEQNAHLLKMKVVIGADNESKEMLFHVQAAKNGRGWELHEPTLKKIRGQIEEEGFDPESFNFALFKCRAVSRL